MDKVKVKICGITNLEDASMAVELGADALGFIFAPSPRQIAPQKAREIIRTVPPFIKTVGVFVNQAPAAIKEIMQYCGLDLVQLHGDESPAFCDELMPYVIKAIRIKDKSSLQHGPAYHGKVRALLLDTYSKEKAGGTGKTFDWELAIKTKKQEIPVILSGGLTPSNIAAAIHAVRPYAVDVNSGIESYPGKKSPILMNAVMAER
ncbi:MAG: phosphoribosylanthranilate isomerase [Desulfobacterales bacterium]|jgi:phosphoribosylanthranilate isomerase